MCMCTNTRKFVLTVFWFFAFAMGYVLQFGERVHKSVHYGSDIKTDTVLVYWSDTRQTPVYRLDTIQTIVYWNTGLTHDTGTLTLDRHWYTGLTHDTGTLTLDRHWYSGLTLDRQWYTETRQTLVHWPGTRHWYSDTRQKLVHLPDTRQILVQ